MQTDSAETFFHCGKYLADPSYKDCMISLLQILRADKETIHFVMETREIVLRDKPLEEVVFAINKMCETLDALPQPCKQAFIDVWRARVDT